MMQQYYSVVKNPSAVWVNRLMIQPRIDSQYYRTDFVENEYKIEQIGCEKLGEIIERGDYGVLPDSEDYCEKGVPLIRGTNLRDLTIDDKEVIRVPKDYLTSKSEIQHRDILILIKGATIDAEWSVAIVPNIRESMIYNGSIFRVRVKTGYDPYYITAFMSTKYFLLQKTRAISNTGIYYNDKNSLENFMIAIPSPEIQKHIGDKVRRAEELREEANKLKEEINEQLYSMLKLPDNLVDNNEKHNFVSNQYLDNIRLDATYYLKKYIEYENILSNKELVSLKHIIKESRYGASIAADYCETGIPFLRGLNILENEINNDILYLNESLRDEVGKAIVNTGDILITRSGSVGITAVVDDKKEGYAFGSFIIKLVVDKENWNPYYISAFLNSFWGKWQIERQKNGSVQQNINLQEIERLMIPIFDLDKQKIFEKLIKEYIDKKTNSEQLIQEAKQDVEDLIEGNFEMSKLNNDSSTESRC